MTPPVEVEFSSRRRWLVLLAMTGSLTMIMMDTTVVGVALPVIGRELGLDESGLAWVVNAYLLALASLLALGGRIGDLIGKARAFRLGVVVFAGASLLCGLSTSGTMLIASRVLQAIGAVLMQPASSAIVISTAEPGREGRAMGFYTGISMLGLVAGPVIGGVLTTWVGWSWIFYVNLPIAVFALAIVTIARPPALRDPDRGLDLPSVFMLVVALWFGVGAVQQVGNWGFDDPRTLGGLAVGIVGIALFMRRQFRLERPLIHVELFRDRGFLVDAAMLGLVQFALTGTVIHLSILTQATWDFDAQAAGFATLPLVLPVIVLVHVAGRMYDRHGVRPLAVPAGSAVALSVVGLGVGAMSGSVWLVFLSMVVLGTTMPFVSMAANTDGMRRVGPARRGLASGVMQTVRMVGSALGIAVTTAVATRFEPGPDRIAALDCGDLPAETVEAAATGDLAALARVAEAGEIAEACLEALRSGIASGIGWGFVVAGVVSAFAVPVALAWREAPDDQGSPSAPAGEPGS